MNPAAIATTSASSGFSVTVLLAAGAAGLAWLTTLGAVALVRRPPRVTARGSGGLGLPPEPPAVAGLLCDDFVVGAEAAPATLLDLAARRVVVLEEVQPGHTVCRLRGADTGELAGYERMVLDQLRAKALDGVVPTEALTTGTDDASTAWHRRFARYVVGDAQQRGLTRDRWPARLVAVLGLGALVVGGLVAVSGLVGGDAHGDATAVAAIAAVVAVLSIPLGLAFVTRLGRSLAQLPTPAGLQAAATARGLQRTLQEHGGSGAGFADLPPAAVVLWDRVFAYAAAMGAARRAVTLLPLGAEDDHRAWSRIGGRWRRVRVRYPRAWPPAWGKHPALAILLAILWGGGAGAATYWLARLASSKRDPSLGFSQPTFDWIGRITVVAIALCALVVLWALLILVRAVPDLWTRRQMTGEVVRVRRRTQVFASGNKQKFWYYLAVDDGSGERVRAWRVRPELWHGRYQGELVTAEITPGLAHVRTIVDAPLAPAAPVAPAAAPAPAPVTGQPDATR